jgi:uncharacterized protein (DUF1330 family)
MPAYIVVDVGVTDPVGYEGYKASERVVGL